MELTTVEKKVLNGISFHTDEIEKGDLCPEDTVLLNEMRQVEHYLQEKYPSYTFEITGCEPKSGTTRTYSEWYFKCGEIERDSAFIAMSEETENGYAIRDAFFGQVIKGPIRQELERILQTNGFSPISIEVSFWDYLGKEFDEHLDANKVLKGELEAGNDFKIFLDDSKLTEKNYEQVKDKIKELFQSEGITGEVYLVILKDADSDVARDRLYSDNILL